MLERDVRLPSAPLKPGHIRIRPMLREDLPVVAELDAAAFEPLWQNSLLALQHAYPHAALATVADLDGQLIGYQISTRNSFGVHLARLAVRPACMGQGVGQTLVGHLVQTVAGLGLTRLTVNTQSDNRASLALYRKIGFQATGERYPVYQIQLN